MLIRIVEAPRCHVLGARKIWVRNPDAGQAAFDSVGEVLKVPTVACVDGVNKDLGPGNLVSSVMAAT